MSLNNLIRKSFAAAKIAPLIVNGEYRPSVLNDRCFLGVQYVDWGSCRWCQYHGWLTGIHLSDTYTPCINGVCSCPTVDELGYRHVCPEISSRIDSRDIRFGCHQNQPMEDILVCSQCVDHAAVLMAGSGIRTSDRPPYHPVTVVSPQSAPPTEIRPTYCRFPHCVCDHGAQICTLGFCHSEQRCEPWDYIPVDRPHCLDPIWNDELRNALLVARETLDAADIRALVSRQKYGMPVNFGILPHELNIVSEPDFVVEADRPKVIKPPKYGRYTFHCSGDDMKGGPYNFGPSGTHDPFGSDDEFEVVVVQSGTGIPLPPATLATPDALASIGNLDQEIGVTDFYPWQEALRSLASANVGAVSPEEQKPDLKQSGTDSDEDDAAGLAWGLSRIDLPDRPVAEDIVDGEPNYDADDSESEDEVVDYVEQRRRRAAAHAPPDDMPLEEGAIPQAAISGEAIAPAVERETAMNDAEVVPPITVPVVDDFSRSVAVIPTDVGVIFDRWYLIENNESWPSTATRFTEITQRNLFEDLLNSVRATAGVIDYHALMRMDFLVKVIVNNCPYNAGQLIMYWEPPNETLTRAANCVTSWPHAFICAGGEHSATLECPWFLQYRATTPALGAVSATCPGLFKVMVWSPLTAGTGTPATVSFSIWIKPLNVRVAVKAIKQSGAGKHAGVLDSILSSLPVISDIAGSIGKVVGFFDSPPVESSRAESLTCSDHPKPVVRTTLTHKEEVFEGQSHFAVKPCYSLIERCRERGLAAVFSWSTTQASSASVAAFPVHPCYTQFRDTPIGGYDLCSFTQLGYFSSLYQYFRGSINVTIEVVCTRYHQGQLFVAWNPARSNAGVTLQKLTNLCSTSIAIGQAEQRTTMTIPYAQVADWLQIGTNWPNINMGWINIMVQNPLTAPVNVSSAVEVMVYLSAGDDYELRMPSVSSVNFGYEIDGIYVQSAISDTARDIITPIDFTERRPLGALPAKVDHSDVRTHLRKPYEFRILPVGAGAAYDQNAFVTVNLLPHRTRPMAYLAAWKYYSGSVRWTVHNSEPNNSRCVFNVAYDPDRSSYRHPENCYVLPTTLGLFSHYVRAVADTNCQPAFTVEQRPDGMVPYRLCSSTETKMNPTGEGILSFRKTQPGGQVEHFVTLRWSAGDDFELHIPMPPPRVRVYNLVPNLADEVDAARKPYAFSFDDLPVESNPVVQSFRGSACLKRPVKPASHRVPSSTQPTSPIVSTAGSSAESSSCLSQPDGDDADEPPLRKQKFTPTPFLCGHSIRCPNIDVCAKHDDYLRKVDIKWSVAHAIPQGGGPAAFIEKIVALLRSIYESTTQLPAAVAAVVSAAKVVQDVAEFLKSVPVILARILDDVLPILTAIYSIYNGDAAAKAIGLASLTRIIYRNLPCPTKPQEGMSHFTDIEFEGTSVDGEGDVFVQGWTDHLPTLVTMSKGVGSTDAQYFLSCFSGMWFASLLKPHGYSLGSGYTTYMRRVIGKTEATFQSAFASFWHTIVYFFFGDSMNKEWERAQVSLIIKTVNDFDHKQAMGYYELDQLSKPFNGSTYFGHLEKTYRMALNLRKLLTEIPVPASAQHGLQRIIDCYSKKRRLCEYRTTQPEPVAIFLGGDPGVGKSLLLSTIIPTVLLKRSGVGEGVPDREVYNVPISDKAQFWDGYEGQPYVIMDELMQAREGEDALTLIRAINTIRMPVAKAALEDKGIVFRSQFFAVTSNATSVTAAYTKITCTDAIVRRLPFCYTLTVKPAFRKADKLDMDKFAKLMQGSTDYKDLDQVWSLVPLNFNTGQPTSAPAEPLSVVIDKMVAMHLSRKESHASVVSMCAKIAENVPKYSADEAADEGSSDSEDETEAAAVVPPVRAVNLATLSRLATAIGTVKQGKSSGKDDEAGPSRVAPTVLAQYFDVIAGDIEDMTTSEADDAMIIIRSYNDEELGGSAKALRDLFVVGEETPFIKWAVSNPQLHHLGLDALWRKSTAFKTPSVKKRVFQGVLKALAVAGLATSAIYVIIKTIGLLFRGGAEILQSYTGQASTKMQKPPAKLDTAKVVPQGGNPDVTNRVEANVRAIMIRCNDSSREMHVQALALDNRTILVPNHFYEFHRENVQKDLKSIVCIAVHGEKNDVIDVMPIQMGPANSQKLQVGDRETDVTLVVLQTERISKAKSVWHFIQTMDDTNVVGSVLPAILLSGVKKRERLPCFVGMWTRADCMPGDVFVRAEGISTSIEGDCGRPYVMDGAKFVRPIVGMHSWLSKTRLYAGISPIYYESCRKAFDIIGLAVTPVEMEEAPAVQYGPVLEHHERYWNTRMELLGNGTFGGFALKHYTPVVSKFVRVRHRGVLLQDPSWQCDMEPAAQKPVRFLRDGAEVLVHPLFTNAQKYILRAESSIPVEMYQHCLHFYETKLEKCQGAAELTWHQAINGYENLQPLMLNTSAGVWTALGFKDGKHQFFDPLPAKVDDITGEMLPIEYKWSNKAETYEVPLYGTTFVQRCYDMDAMARVGEAPYTIWVSTVKDELRKREKVETGVSRVFEQCGLDMTLLLRRYFGKFLSWFRSKYGFTLHSGIGADKEVVWGEYAKGFLANSQRFFCADYKNWDGSMGHHAFQFFEDIANAFYRDFGSPACKARAALLESIRRGVHLAGDCMFTSDQGNKSGNPFTDVLNTIGNTLVTYCWYLLLMREKVAKPTLRDFDQQVRFLTYGDDVIGTIREDLVPVLSGPKIQAVLKALGYQATSALKSATMEESIGMEDATFLKSGFRQEHGVWFAPMEKSAIFKELRYRPKKFEGDDEDLKMRCAIVQRFLAHHGRDDMVQFQQTMISKGIPPSWVSLSYGEVVADLRAKQSVAGLY